MPEDDGLLVRAAYALAELLGGEADAIDWLADASPSASPEFPANTSEDNQALLAEQLSDAGVLLNGQLDADRARDLRMVLRLAPLMRSAEDARRPAPRSRIVCTIPPEVRLPAHMRHVRRSLAILVADSLRTPGERVLLAAPYWSADGAAQLLEPARYAAEHGVPITLAGARRDNNAHFDAMKAFASDLLDMGGLVRVLAFAPPRERSLFHAKIVAGKRGYMGTGNLSMGGFEDNVEVGLPLDETDVMRVWWLVESLEEAGLLVPDQDC